MRANSRSQSNPRYVEAYFQDVLKIARKEGLEDSEHMMRALFFLGYSACIHTFHGSLGEFAIAITKDQSLEIFQFFAKAAADAEKEGELTARFASAASGFPPDLKGVEDDDGNG